MKAVEDSLRRLQTDHIGLYQLHGGTLDDPIEETIGAFEDLVRQGKILYYGISSIRPSVIRAWVERSRLSSVMVQYSLLDRRPEESVLPLLQEKGKGVLVRGALAQGLLIDKPAKPYLGHQASAVAQAAEAIASIAGNENRTVAAMGYVWEHPAVTSIVAGIHTMLQLDQALEAWQRGSLTQNSYRKLGASIRPNLYTEHR